MKKWRFYIFGLLILLAICLFRGGLYRIFVAYKPFSQRTLYTPTHPALITALAKASSQNPQKEVHSIIKQSLSFTASHLYFTVANNENNPNKLLQSQQAHCVGYAAFFATTCQYLLQKQGLSGEWKVKHKVGKLLVFGHNIHSLFSSSFFQDHDFVTIENVQTGEIYAVDPSVYDYFYITYVHALPAYIPY